MIESPAVSTQSMDPRRRGRRLRRSYDALLTGVPFGIFKVAAGWVLWQAGLPALGVLAVLWGSVDVLLNLLVALVQPHLSYCLLGSVGRWLERRGEGANWEELLLALDTFLSFAIVAAMIGLHLLPTLPPTLGRAWDVAVIFNVLGVGVERLYLAMRGSMR